MSKNKIVYLIIAAILLIVGFLLISKESNSVQPKPTDDRLVVNNTLQEVDFCGKTYNVKQVLIDGVDVVQKIGQSTQLNNSSTETICKNIELNNPNPDPKTKIELTVGEVQKFPGSDIGQQGDIYAFNISVVRFNVNTSSGEIYLNGSYDGSLIGPIGNFK